MRATSGWAGAFLLTLWGCGGGGGSTPTDPGAPGGPQVVTVELRDNLFDPKSIQIQPGTTVRWILRGAAPDHTVTAKNGAFDSGFAFPQPGAVFERTFSAADDGRTFEYFCATHRACCQMQGSIRVGAGAPSPSPGY